MGRLGLSQMGCVLIVSGAFGLFKRTTAVEVGGFSHNTVGEDMEMVVKMHRLMRDRGQPYRITYIAEPVSWTEAPENLRDLGNQRARWQRGTLEVFFKHRDMLLNPKYGRIGMYAMTTVFIVDVVGPLFETLGLIIIPLFWALGILSTPYLLALTAVAFIFGVFLSTATLILEEIELRRFPKARHLAIIAFVAVLENFGYRQLCSFWRLRGWWEFLRKKKSWGAMSRKGFQSS
jgi:cellulose synthase/poly-beta-1,6-N-acetylglucosamine synthase-like glycosyltransferase